MCKERRRDAKWSVSRENINKKMSLRLRRKWGIEGQGNCTFEFVLISFWSFIFKGLGKLWLLMFSKLFLKLKLLVQNAFPTSVSFPSMAKAFCPSASAFSHMKWQQIGASRHLHRTRINFKDAIYLTKESAWASFCSPNGCLSVKYKHTKN